jgi:hypothetical protein
MALTNALSFGVTAKYLYAGEPDLAIELTDTESLQALQTPSGLRSLISPNSGYGYDAGLLLFKQGRSSDFRLALKVDDVGGTKLAGDGSLKSLKQTLSYGVAYTLHTGTDAIHCSLDYRDVQGAYGEEIFKRVRLGTKLLFTQGSWGPSRGLIHERFIHWDLRWGYEHEATRTYSHVINFNGLWHKKRL